MTTSPRFPCAAALLVLCLGATADELRLRDGSRIEGTLQGASARTLHLRTADGIRHVPIAEVEAASFAPRDHAPRAPTARATAPAMIVGDGSAQTIRRAPNSD